MAAPTYEARVTPLGEDIPLQDGYRTVIGPSSNPNIGWFEKSVKPPGMDGGDPVDTTTMWNATYMTKAPRSLKDFTNVTCRAAYDPILYTEALALINSTDTFNISFSDGTTIAFYGYLKSFEPQEITEGTQPEADIEIVVTNWDATLGVEAGPVVDEVGSS